MIESRAAAGLDGPAARGPVLRPAIGGDFLEATEVSDQAVDAAAPSDTPGHTGSSGATPLQGAGVQAPDVQPEEFDDLDEAYEDLYVDDTGELPPFRDRGPQSPSGGRQ